MRRWQSIVVGVCAVLAIALAGGRAAADEAVDYAKVKEIFAAKCYSCHGAEKQKGGLRLDGKALAMKGGVTGPSFAVGDGKKSYLVQRLRGEGGEDQMPLKADPLPEAEIALISKWIDQGAKWPDGAETVTGSGVTHWSFAAPKRVDPPAVKDEKWARNPIDRFVLARLEKEGIAPSPQAPRATLLRRLSLDLTGLPPTPAEIEAFEKDPSPNAYEKQVERLLSSVHYGEKWGRHWLDGARYADSNGYSLDRPRSIWPYRDWVINALNADMPFDQFTIEQLAGDMLPDAKVSQKIATGFHRNTQINEEGGIDPEQFRVEALIDRVGTTGTVFLGLTVACAQCHNHKFDPISQKEFYRLMAFFNNADEPKMRVDTGAAEDPKRKEQAKEQMARLEAELKEYAKKVPGKVAEWEKGLTDDARARLKPEVQAALKIEPAKRDKKQTDTIANAYKADDPEYTEPRDQLAALKKQESEGVTTLVMAERSEPRVTKLLIKGDFARPGDVVTPGVLSVMNSLEGEKPNRLDLAKWIVDPRNPLTARVTVNRIWQQYFGKGLVETENDFGTQGTPPTHPELLDWLATEFMQRHWSMKAMHRLIVTSATYRQSSVAREDLAQKDPYNRLLARQARLRLEAENVRDVALATSGLMVPKVGGPSVFPPQPEGVATLGQSRQSWRTSTGDDRYRRGMYTFWFRATPHPLLGSFDAPDGTSACTRRPRSNTPLQALTLLNDEAFVEFAQGLAHRMIREGPADAAGRIDYGFALCTGRKPSSDERAVLMKVLEKQRSALSSAVKEAEALAKVKIPTVKVSGVSDAREVAAWTIVARVLLNLDETITRE